MERRAVERVTAQARRHTHDDLVVERPLLFVADEVPLLTTMRTPGHDLELVLGHLHCEGIITSADDAMVELKRGVDSDVACIALRTGQPALALATLRRVGASVSSCGVCGRLAPFHAPATEPRAATVPEEHIAGLLTQMRAQQLAFERTGAIHAAGLYADLTAPPLVVREDIGRHNAVDKVVGWLLSNPSTPRPLTLTTSGRASFEIVHKAACAGIGAVVAVSAASTLAVDTARSHGVSLFGFVREGRAVVYHRA